MYSTYNEGKSVAAERFIRTLKSKIFKHMTAISKRVYFDALDDIVNKYNNTVHREYSLLNTMKIQMKKVLNLKLVIMLKFQNMKTFLLKDILQFGQKKFLLLAKLKMQYRGLMLLVI